jgi:hypothetical protein
MTLLSICQTALQENAQFAVPATIVGNTDPTAVRLLALANRTGRNLLKVQGSAPWQAAIKTYTFSTVNGTATYALPSDFESFLALTMWDRTNHVYLKGPISATEYEVLNSGSVTIASQIMSYFRVVGNLFTIFPTPTSARTIAFQYGSKWWVDTNSDGVADSDVFVNDTDTTIFDDDLMVLGVRWRFLAADGGAFDVEKDEFQQALDAALASDGGKDIIRFGQNILRYSPFGGYLPESGFG